MMRAVSVSAILLNLCSLTFAVTRLDINRLYSLPSLIGTAPQGFVWSADSKSLAFLWNDDGVPFRDVWLVSRGGTKPIRVTRMPRPHIPSRIENDLMKMQEAADAEISPGVSQVAWSPDQSRLLFLFEGKLYSVIPGAEPTLLTDKSNITSVSAASQGNKITFQSGGELFLVNIGPDGSASRVSRVGTVPISAESIVWSHDGHKLAFFSEDLSQIP